MNQINDTKLIIICEAEKFGLLAAELLSHHAHNTVDLPALLNNREGARLQLRFEADETLAKYRAKYLEERQLRDSTSDALVLKHVHLWARAVSHLFKGHIEIELSAIMYDDIKKAFFLRDKSFKNWINKIGSLLDARLIYVLEDFEHYHLRWFDSKPQTLTLSNVDTFDNWQEAQQALKVMAGNWSADLLDED